MSYADYGILENLAYDLQTRKISFGKAIELGEMCLGIKLPEIPGLNEPISGCSISEPMLPLHEYLKRVNALIDFEESFQAYAEISAPSGKLTI